MTQNVVRKSRRGASISDNSVRLCATTAFRAALRARYTTQNISACACGPLTLFTWMPFMRSMRAAARASTICGVLCRSRRRSFATTVLRTRTQTRTQTAVRVRCLVLCLLCLRAARSIWTGKNCRRPRRANHRRHPRHDRSANVIHRGERSPLPAREEKPRGIRLELRALAPKQ